MTYEVYGYFRSSAAYRLRIALHIKGVAVDEHYIHLRQGGQYAEDFLGINPQGFVPALVNDGRVITQSLAIIEYLDELHPSPPLFPTDAWGRARVRSLALAIACDIHPLNNLRVLNYLTGEMGLSTDTRDRWYRHWIAQGFSAVERMLKDSATGHYCHGDSVTMADVFLVPQVFNAERYDCDLESYPTIRRIAQRCRALPEFRAAEPSNQPDAEP